MAAPTLEEIRILAKFRESITDLDLTEKQRRNDMFLITWLRARELNVEKAKDMLEKSVAWRKTEDIENVINFVPPRDYQKLYPYEILGKCKEGCPVLLVHYGKYDPRGIVEAGEKLPWFRYIFKCLELLLQEMEEHNSKNCGTPVTQVVTIVDMQGSDSLRQIGSVKGVQAQLELTGLLDSNYPEILKSVYIINSSRIFVVLFDIVKQVLSARTFAKVELYSSNEAKWKPVLLKAIPSDVLPQKYGGTRPNSGEELDSNGTERREDHRIFTNARVDAGSKLILDFEITEQYSVLSWAFKITSYDIGFSIIHNGTTEIVKYAKYSSEITLHEDCLICECIGKYSLIFDNSFSRFRSKTLSYHVETTTAIQRNGAKK